MPDPSADRKKVEEYGRLVAAAAKQYEIGKLSAEKFNAVLKKSQRVPGFMDFYSFEGMAEDREETYKSYIDNLQLGKFDGNWWRNIKKEAGIKSAKLFSSDAQVGKHIDRFNASVAAWKKSGGGGSRLGDPDKLRSALKEAEELKKAFNDFLHKKEFTSDLARQLQTKIREFDQSLDQLIKHEKDLLKVYLDHCQAKKDDLMKTLKQAGLPV